MDENRISKIRFGGSLWWYPRVLTLITEGGANRIYSLL